MLFCFLIFYVADNVLLSTLNTMEVSDIGYDLQLTTDESSDSSENSETFVPSTDSSETECSSDENNDFIMHEVRKTTFLFLNFCYQLISRMEKGEMSKTFQISFWLWNLRCCH